MRRWMSLMLALCACVPSAPLLALGEQVPAHDAESDSHSRSQYEWIGPVSPKERALAECLRASRRAEPDEMSKLLRKMVDLGQGTVEACLSILAQGRVPKAAPDDEPQKLSVPQRELLLSALGELPASEARNALEALLRDEIDESRARTAVDVLGVIGSARDLQRLAMLLPRDATGQLPRVSKQVLKTAYGRIIARDDAAFAEIAALLRGRDDVIAQVALMALADRGDARALGPCLDLARSRPALAQTAVSLMPRFAGSLDIDMRAEVATWLRSATDKRRVQWTRAVYDALAVFDEGDALPELVGALDGDERGLKDAAFAALKKITGLELTPDAARWNEWLEREYRWFELDREKMRDRLQHSDPAQVVEALKSYAEHTLFRSLLTADLLPLLERREPALRELACRTIGTLKSVAAVHELSLTRDDPIPNVAQAAREALQAVLGAPPRLARQDGTPGRTSDP